MKNPKVQTNNARKKIYLLLHVILIIAIGLTVYASSLNGKFVWDDDFLIKDNIYIRNWSHVTSILTKDMGTGPAFYRPLQMFSYIVDYSFWKFDVRGYHLTNILWHILVVLALYWLVLILFGNIRLAFFTSVLFMVHPIHTEAIAYISGRAEPLAIAFLLVCFIYYIKYCRGGNVLFYICALLSFILAILSKEYSLILPALLILYHYIFRTKVRLNLFLPICAIAFLYIILRLTILKSLLPHSPVYPTTLIQRLPGFFVALVDYIRLLFLPINLHMEYGNALFSFTNYKALFGIVFLVLILIYVFRRKNSNRLVSFSILWFLVALLPQSNIFPINAYMAEHWLYLPSVGFFLILADSLNRLYLTKNLKIFSMVLFVGLIAFYSFLTVKQNNYWKEPVAFYQRTLRYSPGSWRVLNNLCNSYREMNKYDQAIATFRRAISLNPDYAEAYVSIGFVYDKIGKREDAIAAYNKAIELKPDLLNAYNNLGSVYQDIGKYQEAIAAYKKAIEINPDYAKAYNNLGNSHEKMGMAKEAADYYAKAVKIDPGYAEAYYNMANLYSSFGEKEKAIGSYDKALALDKGLVNAYNNLGLLYHNMGKYREAIDVYKKAIKVSPNHAKAYNNLGNSYQELGRYAEAIDVYKKAIEIKPNYAEAHNNLAVAYYRNKQYDLAKEHCNKAIEFGFRVSPKFLELLGGVETKEITH